jgi:hypothetical protein
MTPGGTDVTGTAFDNPAEIAPFVRVWLRSAQK